MLAKLLGPPMVGVASNTVSFTSITLGLLLVMVRIAIMS